MGVEYHTDATKAKMRGAWVRRRAALPSFWERIEVGDCWTWLRPGSEGYGQYWEGGRLRLAHRYAWEQLVGPIPAGLTLDHLCRNRACVNPDHLQPVSMRENVLRGISPIAANARRTVCLHGHPFDEANTRIRPDGRRRCRTCETGYERDRRGVA